MRIEAFLGKLEHVQETSRHQWIGRCPAHDDQKASLSIGLNGSRILVHCHAGCSTEAVLKALGLQAKDLFLDSLDKGEPSQRVYSYQDEQGELLFQVVRKKPKAFYQRRPDGNGGWINNLQGVPRVLYKLQELVKANLDTTVYVVEGEKDADRLASLGLVATTNPAGAGKWKAEYSTTLKGHPVLILPDSDPQGKEHAKQVFESLQGKARSVRILELPELPLGGDVSDFLDAGGTKEDLLCLAEQSRDMINSVDRLAYSESVLDEFNVLLDELGLAGERANAKLLYLALTSRLTSSPISVVVKGPSAGGKSFLVKTVCKAFPARAMYALSGFSEKALVYETEPLEHRYIIMAEAEGADNDFTNYLIRTLLSEQRIDYVTVEQNKGKLEPRRITREGPTGLIVTTTRNSLHPENETRMWSITVKDDPEQTMAVFLAEAKAVNSYETQSQMELQAGSGTVESDTNPAPKDHKPDRNVGSEEVWNSGMPNAGEGLAEWLAFQTWLNGQDNRVAIPYAKWLAEHTRPAAVRLRRDFRAVLQLITAHALLHQKNRERDTDGSIVASAKDYKAVHDLVADVVNEVTEATVAHSVRETVEAVKELREGSGTTVCVEKILQSQILEISKDALYKRIRKAISLGYLVNEEAHRGRAMKLDLGTSLPAEARILPLPEELESAPPSETGVHSSTPPAERQSRTVKKLCGIDRRASFTVPEVSGNRDGASVSAVLTVDKEAVRATAQARTELHALSSSTRPLSPDYDLVGVAGEMAFAGEFELAIDDSVRPAGDHGIDFQTPAGTIDVKTYRKPHHLLREVGKPHADILVLAGFNDATGEAELIGWEWDRELVKCPSREFGYGIANHYKPADELRPISELHGLIACEEPVPF